MAVAAAARSSNSKQGIERGYTALVASESHAKPAASEAILPGQAQVSKLYDHPFCQFGVAAVIFLNFFISATEAQILPEDDTGVAVFFGFEVTFNVIFLIELILNMYANFFWKFWQNGWNVFDVAIVLVSWVSMLGDFPGVTVLRLFRAFRVFRLFKRIESLRMIIIGVIKSLPGISNACGILALVMGVWSIMGVHFFGEDFPDEFGCFFKGMLSCVQMMTYDSWVSGISRPIILYYADQPVTAVYFVSYIFISAIIMANVLIAILVDKYTEAVQELEKQMRDEAEAKEAHGNGVQGQQGRVELQMKHMKQMKGAMTATQDRIVESIVNIRRLCESLQHPMEDDPSEDKPHEGLVMGHSGHDEAQEEKELLPHQNKVKFAFDHPYAQVALAVAIFVNFGAASVQAQLKPLPGSSGAAAFLGVDYVFNAVFLIELLLNMYGNFFLKFFKNLWNVFDFFIVVISLVALFGEGFDVTALRLFRAFRRSIVAFRVVRLLRLKQVKMIVLGVIKSLPGVSNAFVLLGLIMGIWSIMGVNFYSDLYPDEFGSFFKGMLTMLQIMSFDSWSSGITRPIILHDETADVLGGLFFITYVFASAIIMANVVLAILIDKFLSTAKEIQEQEKREKEAAKMEGGEEDADENPMLQFSTVINLELQKLQDVIKGPMEAFTQDLLARVD
eukprot:gnl/MRDRNA2_/MRDRNA2_27145_c0_seq1.p1 gnl/MRDRNA2_/MRDRNA2_27145_c0~~gnl/MRDRNA2_/MRDRNA2_27145_c0_seq1.p1  ORF type:complete len:675 (-),score=131.08 gnl/MRDRNA2_/MRDRNA2_27145_c0_seq1:84-2108(-)